MRKFLTIVFLLALAVGYTALFSATDLARAETYYFRLTQETVNVFWNSDGTQSLDYVLVFENSPTADNLAYVDLGLPNGNFDMGTIYADVDGKPITDITTSGYQGSGSGVALGLGNYAIRPGKVGRVHAFVGVIQKVLYEDSSDNTYASAVFAPVTFGSQYMYGETDLTVTFHLPPGMAPEEPRWHEDKTADGFPKQPSSVYDAESRVTYTWRNAHADASKQYTFGASFPLKYVPESAIVRVTFIDVILGGILMIVGATSELCIPLPSCRRTMVRGLALTCVPKRFVRIWVSVSSVSG